MYFGLLLAGATPGVLAQQAALTKEFSVKDEIEVKNDLDTNPSDGAESTFVEEIASLISKLNAYVEEDKFSWAAKFEYSIEDLSFNVKNQPSFISFGELESPEGMFFKSSALAAGRSLIREKVKVSAGEKHSAWPETLDFKFCSDGTTVRYDISVGTADNAGAQRLSVALVDYLKKTSRRPKSSVFKKVVENTTSKVEDVKVILATHLARSDIDSLLAPDAK